MNLIPVLSGFCQMIALKLVHLLLWFWLMVTFCQLVAVTGNSGHEIDLVIR